VHPELRVILQMTQPSDYVDATCVEHPDGRDIIIPMDLSRFLNSLMFKCAAQPGLSKIILSLLDFEGSAIRRRKAENLRSGIENKYGDCVGKTFGSMRRQFTTAVFIGILRPSMPKHEIQARGFGLCPDPETIIEKEDLLIFIGPKSSPVHDFSMLDTFASYINTAEQMKAAHPRIEENRLKNGATNSKLLQNLLVCGWRMVWQDHPERLHERLLEVVTQRLSGSSITFLNSVNQDLFTDLMVSIGLKRVPDNGPNRVYECAAPNNGIFVRHVLGDAAVPSVLQPIVNDMTVHTVIVLGTQANVRLAGRFRDTRVLNIMLLLRKLWGVKREGVPMHIVGENNEDMTARLALAPKRTGVTKSGKKRVVEHEPDFVNSQAVYARALVQTMAYPLIQPAINDLFEDSPGSCDIVILNANEYVPIGVEMTYGVVRSAVLLAKGERSICIGIMYAKTGVELLPSHDKPVTLLEEDRLVLLKRQLL
jgi:hypothetical protein